MIKTVKIDNFRCFKSLSIEDMPQFILIGGKNNIGKSTLLEAIFMAHDWKNTNFLIDLLGRRGVSSIRAEPRFVWGPLFNNYLSQKPITVDIKYVDSINSFTFSLGEPKKASPKSIDIKSDDLEIDSDLSDLHFGTGSESGYEVDVTISKHEHKKTFSHFMHPQPDKISIGYRNHIEDLNMFKIPSIRTINLAATIALDKTAVNELSYLKTDKQQGKLIDFLKNIDKRIVDIFALPLGGSAVIYVDIGLPSNLPINLMGGGTVRMFQLGVSIYGSDLEVLLVDEIESGIHYSIYPKMWDAIINAAENKKCQIIATTHSLECVHGAAKAFKEKGKEDDFRYIRLDSSKKTGQTVPKYYDCDMVLEAIDSDWELRG